VSDWSCSVWFCQVVPLWGILNEVVALCKRYLTADPLVYRVLWSAWKGSLGSSPALKTKRLQQRAGPDMACPVAHTHSMVNAAVQIQASHQG
jgi:hypothetical protein